MFPDSVIVFIVFGNTDKIFNVITIEDPFPIPFSVIKSLNQRIIIDPVVRARTISLHIAKFVMKRQLRNSLRLQLIMLKSAYIVLFDADRFLPLLFVIFLNMELH